MNVFFTKVFHLFGWTIDGKLPTEKKYILVVAPHTSNWDLIVGLGARFALGEKIHFMAKHSVFFFPLGNILRLLGGIPVDRTRKENKVEQIINLFRSKEKLAIAITPEGTRSQVSRLKEGFYYMALDAKIPLVLVGFDYKSKQVKISDAFWPTGSINSDFPQIIAYFRTINGRFPKEIPDFSPKSKPK
ncbi:MAG TPA: lysophospholipid acyltransferase family protein [Legionella sp.]|nr:lysophospholipid acyltransferase family protein [Legionella sp.]